MTGPAFPADSRPGSVRVGTSGWQYDDWRGTFYPAEVPQRRWLEHYAAVFPTVEINATFYRLPRTAAVQGWHDRVPPDFRFAVKGSRYLTHNKKLRDAAAAVGTVTERLRPLGDRLGVWLWQLPPSLHRDDQRLAEFLAALPPGPGHAIEFRHRSWYAPAVESLLRRFGAAWVWLSDAAMPDTAPVTADFVYLRLHGLDPDTKARYRWDYRAHDLAPWVERLRRAAADGRDCWVYFNNDFAGHAPRNARLMTELLGAAPWPPGGSPVGSPRGDG